MLIECRECKGKVSTEATACPHCGAPMMVPTAAASSTAPTNTLGATSKRGRRIRMLVALLILLGSVWYLLPPSSREITSRVAATAMRAERTITDETFDLAASEYRRLALRLNREARVSVRANVQSGPAIDLYLMDPTQYTEFKGALTKIIGRDVHYKQALSRTSARAYSDSAVLPAGDWSLVMKSTAPLPLLGKGTVSRVALKVTVQN